MNEKLKMQFLGSELGEDENNEESARFHIIPCPLEKTVSYGSGTAQGPRALIEASWELERSSVCEQGIFTQDAIDCTVSHRECLDQLRQRTKSVASQSKVPITLGGEHSLSWAAVQGVGDALGEKIGILQFDAHADLRNCYMGEVHSHASVMNLLVKEGHRLASFGVRALCGEERISRNDHRVFFIDGEELVRGDIRAANLPKDFPRHVYLSFDLDGLDPSIMPAVGTPVPGGLGFYQAIDLVESVLKGRKCVGLDMVELAPIKNDLVSPYTAACLLQRFLSFV
ncbi:MAG: agmatinase family protein [Opitutales bacterium]